MIVEVDIDDNHDKQQLTFSNDSLNTLNFVEMYFDDIELMISLDDLEAVVKAFKTYRDNDKQRDCSCHEL